MCKVSDTQALVRLLARQMSGGDEEKYNELLGWAYKSDVDESPKVSQPTPHAEEVVALWNSVVTTKPQVRDLTDKRKSGIRLRWKELEKNYPDPLAKFEEAFRKVDRSEFMQGSWCTFDWFLKNSTNIIKTLEGNYDNNRQKSPQGYSDKVIQSVIDSNYEF